MADSRQLVVRLVGDSRQLDSTLKKTETRLGRFGKNVGAVGGGAALAQKGGMTGGLLAGGALAKGGALTLGLGLAGSEAIKFTNAASNLEEQVSKSQVVFGDASAAVEEFGKTSARSFGIAEAEAISLAGTFGALFRPMGFGVQQAAKQSVALVKLGSDLASFYNTDVTDALQALQSGITGQIRPLRRYGVDLSAARVNAEALATSGKKVATSLTQQEKVTARLSIIMRDTSLAQGDFARTSQRLANQQRILKAQVEDLETKIGAALVPTMTGAITVMNDMAAAGTNLGSALDSVGIHVDGLAAGIGRLVKGNTFAQLAGLGDALTNLGTPIQFGESPAAYRRRLQREKAQAAANLQGGIGGASAQSFGEAFGLGAFSKSGASSKTAPSFGEPGFKPGETGIPATAVSNKLVSQELDARLSGNQSVLKGVLAQEAAYLQKALKDIRLTPAQENELKQALLGVTGEITSIDDQIIQNAKDKKDALKSAADTFQQSLTQMSGAQELKAALAAKTPGSADDISSLRSQLAEWRSKLAKATSDGIRAQIVSQINTATDAISQVFKDEADAIKSAALTLLDAKTSKIQNQRELEDAKAKMKVARMLGGPIGIKMAARELEDVNNAILRRQLEEKAVKVSEGPRGPVDTLKIGAGIGSVTININSNQDPEQIAKQVLAALQKRGKQGSSQSRGTIAGRNFNVGIG